ncbi:hypothetical protein ACWDZ8_20840 [Streptomyces sp. NPDC003233]
MTGRVLPAGASAAVSAVVRSVAAGSVAGVAAGPAAVVSAGSGAGPALSSAARASSPETLRSGTSLVHTATRKARTITAAAMRKTSCIESVKPTLNG